MGKAKLVCGPANSGKTSLIVGRCLDLLQESPICNFTLILPTNAKIKETKERLLIESARPGIIGLRLFTLLDFAREYLKSRRIHLRETSPIFKRALIAQLLRDLWGRGQFSYFAAIADLEGFGRCLDRLIAEFKENEISPEMLRRAIEAKGPTRKDLEVLAAYEAYQAKLSDLKLADREDLFLLAKAHLKEPAEGPPFGSKALFIDGFYDFNHIQLELVKLLIEVSPETIITLQYEPDRPEVFSLPEKVYGALQGKCAEVVHLARGARIYCGLNQIEANLFRQCPESEPAGQPAPVTIIPAQGLAGEITEVAREIKRLASSEGLGAGSFCVAFRNFEEYVKLIEEIFQEYGIPWRRADPGNLASNPLAKAFMALITAPLNDYGREDILKLLRSPYIKAANGSLIAERAEVLARQCGISRGRGCWEDKLNLKLELIGKGKKGEAVEDDFETGELMELSAEREFTEAEVLAVKNCVLALLDSLSELHKLKSADGLRKKLLELIDKFELRHTIFEVDLIDIVKRDLGALLKLREAIDEASNILSVLKTGGAISLSDSLLLLRSAFDEIRLSEDRGGRESVFVTDLHSLRQLHFPVVFLCGLIEGEFPKPFFYNPIYRDDERNLLNAHLGENKLIVSSTRRGEERIFFYNALTRATRRLYLTYPSADADGKEKTPSYYLDEIEKVFQPGMVHKRGAAPAHCIPEYDDVLCPTDFKRRAFKEIFSSAAHRYESPSEKVEAAALDLMKSVNQRLLENILAANEMERARSIEAEFGPWDGDLQEPIINARLNEEFGPDHIFSPSKLSLFGVCPFLFMCLEVWRLMPLDEVEIEVPPMEIGRLYHSILCDSYRGWLARIGRMPCQEDIALAKRVLSEAIESSFSKEKSSLHPGHRAMLELEKEKMGRALEDFLMVEIANFQGSKLKIEPKYFEVGFGITKRHKLDPMSAPEPLRVELGGESLKIAGVIDRVDIADLPSGLLPQDKGFILIDYKTGGMKIGSREIEEGRNLQLPIYALALKELILKDHEPIECFFYNPKTAEKFLKLEEYKISDGKVEYQGEIRRLVEVARRLAVQFSVDIRRGKFFLSPSRCPYNCSMSPVCRHER